MRAIMKLEPIQDLKDFIYRDQNGVPILVGDSALIDDIEGGPYIIESIGPSIKFNPDGGWDTIISIECSVNGIKDHINCNKVIKVLTDKEFIDNVSPI